MVYTKMTKRAMQIAFEAHRGQVDKNGIPYIYHPVHLAEQMQDEATVCLALLHDVVEDTAITFDDLALEGFAEEVLDVLKLLTHDKTVPYMDYISKIKHNPIACAVKLADLRHNSDLTRLDTVGEQDLERVKKYQAAITYLQT